MACTFSRDLPPTSFQTNTLFGVYIRMFAKSRLRFGLQVRSETEAKLIAAFERGCEEQNANFSVFDRKKLSSEIQIFQPTTNFENSIATRTPRSGKERSFTVTGQIRLPGVTGNTQAPTAVNNNGATLASTSVNVMGGQGTLPSSTRAMAATTSNFVYEGASIAQEHVERTPCRRHEEHRVYGAGMSFARYWS